MHFIEREDYSDPAVRAARYPWGTPPPKIDESLIAETITADVAIIGGGISGLATVARYNQMYRQQNDEDYGKRRELLTPIDKPPFYALKFGPSLLDVFGGVNTDVKLRVLDAKNKPIPGLLAVGMIAGGLYGVDYPLLFNGNSHGRCLTWARQAAETIANGEA